MSAYPIPAEALDDRLAWVGTSGSGKTYNAGTAVEKLLIAKARAVICDPLGVWYGLRLQADGKTPAFPVVIFGGPHGDLPLNEHSGAVIGEAAAQMAESCIVDLSDIGTAAGERRFMLNFLRALYQKASGEPVHLVLDEADMWAPQTIRDKDGDANKLFAITERIVRRGRISGFIPWLITQRPAELSKSVLSQVDGLVAMMLTASQDRDALDAWIGGQADRAEGQRIKAAMPTLQQGQGVVWLPRRAVLDTLTFPAKATFDSSRTPKRGEIVRGAVLKPLDLGRLKERLAKVETEAKANDPAALKAEVARLTRELAKAQKAMAAPPAPITITANAEDIEAARAEGQKVGIALGLSRAQQALAALRIDDVRAAPGVSPAVVSRAPRAAPAPKPTIAAAIPFAGLTGPQQRLLDAVAWWLALGFDAPTRTQVAFIAAYKPNTGTFNTYLGQLSTAGLINYPRRGAVALTERGISAASAPGDGPDLHTRVKAILSGPQIRLLEPLLGSHPAAMSRPELAMASDYQPNTGTFNTYLGQLSTLDLVTYPERGQVRAADWLFPEAIQ